MVRCPTLRMREWLTTLLSFNSPTSAGVVSEQLFHITDWFPTLAKLADISLEEDSVIDGVDQTGAHPPHIQSFNIQD